MLGAGLAMVLFGVLLGMFLDLVALPLMIYGLISRHDGRRIAASLVALLLAGLAAVLSAPVLAVVVSGESTTGEPLTFTGGEQIMLVPPIVVGGTLAASVFVAASAAFRWFRRRSADGHTLPE